MEGERTIPGHERKKKVPHTVKMKPRESHILEDRREGDGEETKPTSRSKLGAGVLPMRVWGSLTLAPLSQLRYVRASWFCETVSDNAHRTGLSYRSVSEIHPRARHAGI